MGRGRFFRQPFPLDSVRGSSVKLGTIQRRLARPPHKDDTHKSRSVTIFSTPHIFQIVTFWIARIRADAFSTRTTHKHRGQEGGRDRMAFKGQRHRAARSKLATPQAEDTLAEWLRRRPAKPMGSPSVGSNPRPGVGIFGCSVACPYGAASRLCPVMYMAAMSARIARRVIQSESAIV